MPADGSTAKLPSPFDVTDSLRDGLRFLVWTWEAVTGVNPVTSDLSPLRGAGWPAFAIYRGSSGPSVRTLPLCGSRRGRGDRIRTCDPLLPKQMRYQAALLPDAVASGPLAAQSGDAKANSLRCRPS